MYESGQLHAPAALLDNRSSQVIESDSVLQRCTYYHLRHPAAVAQAAAAAAAVFMQVGFFDDKVGPITLAAIVMVTLVAITIMAFIDVLS